MRVSPGKDVVKGKCMITCREDKKRVGCGKQTVGGGQCLETNRGKCGSKRAVNSGDGKDGHEREPWEES